MNILILQLTPSFRFIEIDYEEEEKPLTQK